MRPERAINILIALLILFSALKLWNSPEQRISLIQTDGVGYYSFLPAIFIYHDLQFQFLPDLERKYWPNQEPIFKTIDPINGKMNKYFCGVTVLMLPFFLLAHAIALIGGLDADGDQIPAVVMARQEDTRTALAATVGFGLEAFLTPTLALDIRGRYHFMVTDLRPYDQWLLAKVFPVQLVDLSVGFKMYFWD